MNSQDREKFWNTLRTLPSDDPEQDIQKLVSTIKLPKYLFRYRSVSPNSLEALRTNKLYFSLANYYDDPFDTFLYINIDHIREAILSGLQTPGSAETAADRIKRTYGDMITEEQKAFFTVDNLQKLLSNGLLESFLNSTLALRDEVKQDIWSVCFSENGFNEVLWLKYANQHKGFVQIYDLENQDNYLCGKQAKCQKCGINKYGAPIYPIYYSDTPYDATDFSKNVMVRKLQSLSGIQIPRSLYNGMENEMWERERITLIKKKCHEYDEEWRMIANCLMQPPVMMEWIPSGIILGLRMDVKEEQLVVSMAREAGIKNIYKSIIDSQNKLNAVKVTIK